jgi:hypothetical protein
MTVSNIQFSSRLSSSLLVMGLAFCAGCSSEPGARPEPTDFTVKVTSGGKPVSGVNLGLSPVGDALPAGVPLKDGSGKGRAIPGDYMYFVSIGDAKGAEKVKEANAILQTIPKKYHEGDPSRTVTVSNGANLEITLD